MIERREAKVIPLYPERASRADPRQEVDRTNREGELLLRSIDGLLRRLQSRNEQVRNCAALFLEHAGVELRRLPQAEDRAGDEPAELLEILTPGTAEILGHKLAVSTLWYRQGLLHPDAEVQNVVKDQLALVAKHATQLPES